APTADITRWWTPVVYPDAAATTEAAISSASLWSIFAWGFIGGLIALLTPCVWPMIPLTVSFFLKKNRNRRQAIGDALTYGLSIIVIYLALGLVITIVFGASKLNELSTNAIFNLLFFAMLVVFAISFFGAFDIKLPSKWSNSADSRAEETSGLLSIFFMAFTLALVSFSCTGPIIGTLLVEAATDGNFAGPAVGMGAFALALAIPFALFAMFPSMLKEMPKSGGWLNSVKVVLGFLELALSLKFLSVADLAYGWGLLDREWFIALWIVIFFLLGIYLLGKISFPHDTPSDRVSIPRFFLALASLSFAVYLVPGLWGAPLKGVSAFVPPLYTQDFNLYESGEFHQFSDYDEGMAYAAANGKPVLIDFSGYGCVNCRKMEGAVFDTDVIRQIIEGNYVLITLMVDDKKELDSPMKVEENGKTKTLRTIGDKWSYLQRMKFGANTQPFYVVLDNSGSAMTSPYYYDEDVEKFGLWLTGGIDDYKKSGK
ncbi:MAG: thioredoxin family protein, partial [Paramuribaculum sp.]|nr:thioredoxin family protein [Paramuribaculum sp.]